MTDQRAPSNMTTQMPTSALYCDVLVVGSGAGGLACAVTAAHYGLDVIVVEKEDVIGGTSAWSGGWLWVPRNPLAQRAGIVEPRETPKHYLQSELGNRASDPRIDIFLDNAPEMVHFFERNSAVAFIPGNAIPDFHTTPGHALGGRSVCAAPYDGRELGDWIYKMRPPLDVISLAGMGIASGADLAHFFNATRSLKSMAYVTRRILKHARDLVAHRRSMQLVNGNALVARLLRSALDKNVNIFTQSPVIRLMKNAERVHGAVIRHKGSEITIEACKGVVLATGGFPHDHARIGAMFDHARQGFRHHSAAPPSNTGDGLRLGESVGARVSDDLVNAGAWAPVSLVPKTNGEVGRFPHLIERAKPGFIAVLDNGRRFVNEANSYHDFMSALFAAVPGGGKIHAWLICDHAAQRRFGIGWARPFPFPLTPYLRNGYLKRGRTLRELAQVCGIDAQAFEQTVQHFNANAAQGVDPDFNRGESPYNRIQGDPEHRPNPALGALKQGPFYAVELVPGSLGTFAGLRTDAHARVLDANDQPIDGLFATGNDMASIMGGNYPSGGITLGPAMTFGFVIGKVLAGQPLAQTDTAQTSAQSDPSYASSK